MLLLQTNHHGSSAGDGPLGNGIPEQVRYDPLLSRTTSLKELNLQERIGGKENLRNVHQKNVHA